MLMLSPHRPIALWVLIALLIVLGLSGLSGGYTLINDIYGGALGLSPQMLDGSPFVNFLIPGLYLFAVLGICPLVLSAALLLKPRVDAFARTERRLHKHWTWLGVVFVSVALLAWLLVQRLIVGFHWLQVPFLFVGLGLLLTAILPEVQRNYMR